MPGSARTLFRFRSCPNREVVGLGRLPFGWKCSPYICQHALAHLVEQALPLGILLLYNLDDFLLVHYDRGYFRQHTGGDVFALEHGGFLVSPKRVLKPSTKVVLIHKWLDLLGRMVL